MSRPALQPWALLLAEPTRKVALPAKDALAESLIRDVAQAGQLRSRDDVPEDVCQQVYAEEQQQPERQQGGEDLPAGVARLREGIGTRAHINTRHGQQLTHPLQEPRTA
jgi:hypothetical protein